MRRIALATVAGFGVAVWIFPVLWGFLTSFKTERDVLAYPPVLFFTPTLANYRDAMTKYVLPLSAAGNCTHWIDGQSTIYSSTAPG